MKAFIWWGVVVVSFFVHWFLGLFLLAVSIIVILNAE